MSEDATTGQVIEEAKAMNATGTGILSGDPMLDMEKSLEAIIQLNLLLVKNTTFICIPQYLLTQLMPYDLLTPV